MDISREYLAAAIAAKRGKTAKDYGEELWYVLKGKHLSFMSCLCGGFSVDSNVWNLDYAIFRQCFLRKKNVREKNPWKESIEMWNIPELDRYMYVVNVDRIAQRRFAFRRMIGRKVTTT